MLFIQLGECQHRVSQKFCVRVVGTKRREVQKETTVVSARQPVEPTSLVLEEVARWPFKLGLEAGIPIAQATAQYSSKGQEARQPTKPRRWSM